MRIEQMLGIELPLIQAPMAGAQDSALTIAVSEAGGLGSLPCAMLTPEQLMAELRTIRKATDKPINLNFFAHRLPVSDPDREAEWLSTLQPYYREFGVDAASTEPAPVRLPFGEEMVKVVEAFRPEVVSFHFGLPADELLERVRRSGCKILSTATTVPEAVWLEQQGIDGIIAQGIEAGGHRGFFLNPDIHTQTGTMALLPQIIAATHLPVIAAGGIADNAGIRGALAMGAAGVQLGTAFLLCDESRISPIHRQALMQHNAPTALTNIFSGGLARGIVNRVMAEQGPISPQAPAFPLATAAIAPLRSAAERLNRGDFSPLWSGQNRSGCRDIPAAELMGALFKDI